MKSRIVFLSMALALSQTVVSAETRAQTSAPAVSAPPAAAAPAAVPPALVPVPLPQAIEKAANALLSGWPKAKVADPGRNLVIDPLIDGYTGAQNASTRKMGGEITRVVKENYAGVSVIPFTSLSVTRQPLLLIGTFRPINTKNDPAGPTDAFHICLALLDLKSGTVVSKGVARAVPDGVDVTPTVFFQDSPVWIQDAATTGYVKSCQATKVGDPIDQAYADRIIVASLISDAIDAYEAKRYKDAVDLYQGALRTPGGDQLRVYNGLYLSNARLKKMPEAAASFGKLVDHGLKSSKLGVNFLFAQNSTIFFTPKGVVAPYDMWLKTIGDRASATGACLEVVGHTSKKGPPAINDRLSTLRAEYVRDRLIGFAPKLTERSVASGVGSRQTIVGTLTDGPHNAVDRRVEFKTIKCT